MRIENLRYDILSKGEDQPERELTEGEVVYLTVRNQSDSNGDISTAEVHARYIERMSQYLSVRGHVIVEDNDFPGVATYETDAQYPENTPIGELVLKRVTDTEI